MTSKEINKAEHEYMNMCPQIIVLATALIVEFQQCKRKEFYSHDGF
jgi:hypothetical protein